MRTILTLVLAVTAIGAPATHLRPRQEDSQAEVIRLERSALDRWGRGDPGGFLAIYAPEVTYFDPSLERRLDGIGALTSHYEPITGRVRVDGYEMVAPAVQRHGDVAVLTYNLVSHARGPDGTRFDVRWNSTSVYVRFEGTWRVVHSHWSYTQPNTGPMPPG